MNAMTCWSRVPEVPPWFMSPDNASQAPTLFLYCNVVADQYTVGPIKTQTFGQILAQVMIGNVEICGGVNHSASGPGTHTFTRTWLAQAQYYFVDVQTSEAKCAGGAVLEASPDDLLQIEITFQESKWVTSITVHNASGGARGTSTLNIPSPQLRPDLSWNNMFNGSVLRPYASFEAWDAPSNDPTRIPKEWFVNVSTNNGLTFQHWNHDTTGMTIEMLSKNRIKWFQAG